MLPCSLQLALAIVIKTLTASVNLRDLFEEPALGRSDKSQLRRNPSLLRSLQQDRLEEDKHRADQISLILQEFLTWTSGLWTHAAKDEALPSASVVCSYSLGWLFRVSPSQLTLGKPPRKPFAVIFCL